jgi:TrmH family RNA methyltransferase
MFSKSQPNRSFQRSSQIKEISSVQNQLIKDTVLLGQKAKERKEKELFIVEGLREVERALKSGWKCTTIFFEEGFFTQNDIDIFQDQMRREIEKNVLALHHATDIQDSSMIDPQLDSEMTEASSFLKHIQWIKCTPHVFEKIAYRTGVENFVAIFEMHQLDLTEIELPAQKVPLVLVLENVEKSGNLGAILRTANAMGVDAILVCDEHCDLFNPNLIRNSLGGFFDLQIVQCSNEEAIFWIKEQGLQIFVTYLEEGKEPFEHNFKKGSAIVLGAEDVGISEEWLNVADHRILIEMQGIVDSLNVSVSTGMILYEIHRQRKVKSK